MRPLLYLDTARVGQFDSNAALACARASEIALSDPKQVYECLFKSLDPADESDCTIPFWFGLEQFKKTIAESANESHERKLVAASHSASLVKLAAKSIFQVSRKVLTTDLAWPAYLAALRSRARSAQKQIHLAEARSIVSKELNYEEQLVESLTREYSENNCDSLFLTAVSTDGIRMPVRKIVASISRVAEIRFLAIDGAQEFAQFGRLFDDYESDLYLFGGHKWLGTFYPISMALYGRKRTRHYIESTLERLINHQLIDDSLLRLFAQLDQGNATSNETVNFLPLFSASGALKRSNGNVNSFSTRLRNLNWLKDTVGETNWSLENETSSPNLLTAIAVLKNDKFYNLQPTQLESIFRRKNIVLTGYDQGRIRVSLPAKEFNENEQEMLQAALRRN